MEKETTIFLECFGDTPRNRILETLIIWQGWDYSLSDLARASEISWSTLHRVFPQLEKQGLVVQTRTVGRAKLYRINEKNPLVKKMIELFRGAMRKEMNKWIEKYAPKEPIKAKA